MPYTPWAFVVAVFVEIASPCLDAIAKNVAHLGFEDRAVVRRMDLARGYIDLEQPEYEEPWAGLRPMTVDGLPILDWAQPYRNVYLATGYSMLGMTVSPPAGKAMAEMIVTGRRPEIFEPFRVDRFPRALVRRSGR